MPTRDGPLVGPARLWDFLGADKSRPFTPHSPEQHEALTIIQTPWPGAPHPRIYGVNCGRRWGKTTTGEIILWQGMIAPNDGFGPPCVRVTADTEEHAHRIWDRFTWHLTNTPLHALLESWNRDRNLVTFKTGANAQLISADNPNALSGDGVTLWLIDEAQFLTQAAWVNLFPSTTERNGVIVCFGVSEGEGPFREICYKGDHPQDNPEYLRLCYPTSTNPLVPREAIEFAARELGPVKFKQLYLCLWEGEVGKIFRNIEGCVNKERIHDAVAGWQYTKEHRDGHTYYGGLDLARLSDWTVYSIWNREGELVAWDRFSLVDWELQKVRIHALSAVYGHPKTMVDATGVGDPIVMDLARKGMNVEGYQIGSNLKKRALIDDLAIRVGGGLVRFPNLKILRDELARFEAKRSTTPNSTVVTYSAPVGMTDDFVMSAALAAQLFPTFAPSQPNAPDWEDVRQHGEWEAFV